MNPKNFYENIFRQTTEEKSSERGLGITFAFVLFVIGIARFYRGSEWGIAWFSGAAVFLFLAYFWITPLRPLNNLWNRLGLLLFHIVNPFVMGVVFFTTIFPVGALMRIFGKDPLRLKLDRDVQSYWQERTPSDAAQQNMKNQF